MNKPISTKEQLRKQLSSDAYYVTQEQGTERPYTGEYWNHFQNGTYHCVCCGEALFSSDAKYDAGCGWPSFSELVAYGQVSEFEDHSLGMVRIEVRCNHCDAHLGHRFPDGPQPSGQRYCINSVSLEFRKKID